MPINKVSTVNAGVYTNPNTFARSLSKAYENLGTQLNLMVDAFATGQRATVLDATDTRWSWKVDTGMFGTSINSSVTGLDGTALYSYGGTDYISIDPIFLVYNPDNVNQVRPATVYESFINTKSYIDTAITERTSAILDIANSLDIDLTGAADGTIVISVSEAAAPSPWKVISNYGSNLDYAIVGPGGNKVYENSSYLGLEAPFIKLDTNYLDLAACNSAPTGALADRGRIYYNSADSKLHLVDHTGTDTALGAGSGNTGLITFDGVQIIGAGTASGDGYGFSTMELVPDSDLYANDQYLIIDPTSPNHIHIRSGGVQDDSNAILVLGGENSNVTIADKYTNHVTIKSANVALDSYYDWQFNNNGSTGFPVINIDLLEGGTTAVEALQFSNNALYSVITGASPLNGDDVKSLIIQGLPGESGARGGSVFLFSGSATAVDAGSIGIKAGSSTGASNWGGTIDIVAGSNLNATGSNVNLIAGTGSSSANAGKIEINSGSYFWQFKPDGSTIVPTQSVDLHTGGATFVEAFKFGENTLKSVITGATPSTGEAVKPLIIQGQSQTGAAGGDVYVWGGDSTAAGGNIEILAGHNEGSTGTAGTVTIKGGNFATGSGGNIAITGGTGTTHGEVTITSNSNTWTFNNDGNTTIPDLKDIRDVAGNTAIGGGNRVKNYNSSSGSVVPIDENNIYAINTTSQATNVKLPASGTTPIGYEFTVIDTIGNAASKNITVTAESGDSIVSAPSGIAIDTNYGLLAFKYIGNKNWVILYGR